jgi:hypothetical protein
MPKVILLGVAMLNVIMLSIIMLNAIVLSVIMLSINMLSVIMLNAIMLNAINTECYCAVTVYCVLSRPTVIRGGVVWRTAASPSGAVDVAT